MVEYFQNLLAADAPKQHFTIRTSRRQVPGVRTYADAIDCHLLLLRMLEDDQTLLAMPNLGAETMVLQVRVPVRQKLCTQAHTVEIVHASLGARVERTGAT